MNVDWLILGGGIHGVHIAARLIGEGGVAPERLCIVDPAERLLTRWRDCTATTGMTHLRSPVVHHLDLEPMSLKHFAGKRGRRKGLFAPPYDRPSLALFDAHCDHVVEAFGLVDRHVQGRAVACSVDHEGALVQLSDQRAIEARHVVLALGASEQPLWPEWAPRDHARVRHVFEPGFDGWPQDAHEAIAVIGGGISAGQVYGASDRHGAYPAQNRVTPADLTATIFHLLGIDVTQTFHDFLGRPHHICKGKPISELVG